MKLIYQILYQLFLHKNHLLMVSYSLDTLQKSSKRKEMRMEKEKVEVLQQTIYSVRETGK